jgi:hypothetical protein
MDAEAASGPESSYPWIRSTTHEPPASTRDGAAVGGPTGRSTPSTACRSGSSGGCGGPAAPWAAGAATTASASATSLAMPGLYPNPRTVRTAPGLSCEGCGSRYHRRPRLLQALVGPPLNLGGPPMPEPLPSARPRRHEGEPVLALGRATALLPVAERGYADPDHERNFRLR